MSEQFRRKESRIPCVGIDLLYSPLSNTLAQNVGSALSRASLNDLSLHGLSFDTSERLPPGTHLVVFVKQPDNKPTERLFTIVRWCREMEGGLFRSGVEIEPSHSALAVNHSSQSGYINLQAGPSVPSTLELPCPACHRPSAFELLGMQTVRSRGVMPLYNCPHCTTTRSLVSLLAHMRGVVGATGPGQTRSGQPGFLGSHHQGPTA